MTTNNFIYDILELNPESTDNEYVWIAKKPEAVEIVGKEAVLSVPFYAHRRNKYRLLKVEDIQPRILPVSIQFFQGNVIKLSLQIVKETSSYLSPVLHEHSSLVAEGIEIETVEHGWVLRNDAGEMEVSIQNIPAPLCEWVKGRAPDAQVDFDLVFSPKKGTALKGAAYDQFFPGRYDALPLAFVEQDGAVTGTTFGLKAELNEKFAGTGERFVKADLSGSDYILENTDGIGANSRRAYKNVPFFLSSRGYGVFTNTHKHAKLSLAGTSTRATQSYVEDSKIEVYLIGGDNLERVLYNYRRITGFPPKLPKWSYGVWMSRMTYKTAQETEAVAERLRAEDYPCDVMHLDTGWFDSDWGCNWKFGKETFPNPAEFIARLKDKGFRLSLWQKPLLNSKAKEFAEWEASGFVAATKGSSEATDSEVDSGESAKQMKNRTGQVDFSNPKAVEHYQKLIRDLCELGAAVIKTDFGEDILMNVDYANATPEELHNTYGILYQQYAFEMTKAVTGEGITWARAGWAGCQRYPIHWAGDSACTWEGLAGTLRGGLHLGLSGFAYWSHDVGGFHGIPDFMFSKPSDELYLRWTQFGVFSSHFRYHGTSPREPYEYESVSAYVRQWLKLRYALIPYIEAEADVAIEGGAPLLTSMILHHTEDPNCWHVDDQYYFGRSLLVAPVLNESGERAVYLPKGEWINFWTGEEISSVGQWIETQSSLDQIPVFVVKGARLSFYPDPVKCTDEMDAQECEWLEFNAEYRGFKHTPLHELTGWQS